MSGSITGALGPVTVRARVLDAFGERLEALVRLHRQGARLGVGAPFPADRTVPGILYRDELPSQRQWDLVGRCHALLTDSSTPRTRQRRRRRSRTRLARHPIRASETAARRDRNEQSIRWIAGEKKRKAIDA